jgi:ankyrin repeat protein
MKWPLVRAGSVLRVSGDDALVEVMHAIASGDAKHVAALLRTHEGLASANLLHGASRQESTDFFLSDISHHVYRGDTAVHVAAAAYEAAMLHDLVLGGGSVEAVNRRGARPLHYAVDGGPGSPRWDPDAQRRTVRTLLELGADADASDKNGTTPLLRAARNRCAAAVEELLEGGANQHVRNNRGSTALQIASRTTGKSGSGSQEAQAQQREIIRLLRGAQAS